MSEDSPSAGWREVYAEMGVSTSAETDTADCPDCGDDAPRIRRRATGGVFYCPSHGSFEVAG
jgi:predicted RNA-binding Zn-ribbon protein involved in translation (DUF1610 family)